ncbi:hypothetical protein [Mesorhizobium sp. M1E.F.Ca.ET.041.01.1.1]|uniref:hypothetical protein n=1 Tax=Mesorhizobium sp. M1E.F.Ca.ET.041.01.1.1 TaxID=2496759 RepID=UPI000FCCBF1B|nr:hypothetical protein [Mesorhizobium sp. M1E.F.Ca.ET.041.01.1.1]RUW31011.1 hypothetical protein EOA38_19035 [Mesorhizobium sp. M1E.F.Ca.ET.041.01.1.1]RWD92684.1 MAG: hypothetical protein EOS38_02330 [Mesorhizobium sp.]
MLTEGSSGRTDEFKEKVQAGDIIGALRASGIAKQTPDQKAAIEAVMFALWAQGQRQRSGWTTSLLVLLFRAAILVGDALRLPIKLIQHSPRVIIAAAFVLAVSYLFGWSLSYQAQIGSFLVAALVLFKDQLSRWIRDFLFDIGDIFSLGTLTRFYIARHFLSGPMTVLEDADGLKLHLATSRPLTSGPYLEESEAFQEIVARQIDEWPSLRAAIDGFWRDFPKNLEYWRKLRTSIANA